MDEVAPCPELPLDYGILFTGMEHTFSDTESTRERNRKANERLDSFIVNTVQSLPIKDADRLALSHLLNSDKNEISHKSIDATNLKILE